MRRTWLLVIVALTLLPALLFASGGSESAGAKTAKLLYWTQAQVAHAPMVEAFVKAHPNIEIEQVDMPADEQRQVMMSALASGTGPDVFYFELGAGHVDPILKANLVVELEDPAKRFGWKDKLTPFAQAEATHYGKLWAIPNEAEFIAMFYNKQLLGEYGAGEPKTADELAAVLEKIKKAGKHEPIAFGDSDKWPALHRISLGFQWGDGGTDAARRAIFEGASFDTPEFARGIGLVQRLDKNYMPHLLERQMGEAEAVFYSGGAVMMHSGTWNINGALTSDIADKIDFFIPATPGKGPNTVAGCGGGWYASTQSKYPEECLTFLDFTLSKEATDIWFGYSFLPPIPIDVGSTSVPPMVAKAIQSIDAYDMGYFIHHFVSAESVQWIREGYQGLIAGTVTPEQYVKEFEKIAEQARADGFRP